MILTHFTSLPYSAVIPNRAFLDLTEALGSEGRGQERGRRITRMEKRFFGMRFCVDGMAKVIYLVV
jgi:hypothetical protein